MALARRLRDGRTNVLHVGRLVPNKRIEDVVRSFHLYRRIDPGSRLLLVGTDTGLRDYAESLRALVARLGTPGRALPRAPRLRAGCAPATGARTSTSR